MATVNLSWTVEGLHDGIRVERIYHEVPGNVGIHDYLDTLPSGTTEFEDEFSMSDLADRYGVAPSDINLLTYILTTFRGDKEKSTEVQVPIVDTDPQWLLDLELTENTQLVSGVGIFNETDNRIAINVIDQHNLEFLVISKELPRYMFTKFELDGSPLPSDYDFSTLEGMNFIRLLNSQINEGSSLEFDYLQLYPLNTIFTDETYYVKFADGIDTSVLAALKQDLHETVEYIFMGTPFVSTHSEIQENDPITGMAIKVIDLADDEIRTIPWTPTIKGVFLFSVPFQTVADLRP